MPPENDKTITFSLKDERELEIRQILTSVYNALLERGYSPINHIVGYLLSEDPTYITNHKNARSLIRKVERDEILTVLLKSYLGL
ncbi:MAG TPA: IreB family regulatory phosphoprotein [Bacillota bacterium]|nr:IreB family regulatory phosphoprotein [Clostridiales bacterium]HPT84502.1 IreB family regulatory phosphoprotein [Bacillota bacterium]